ncbi:DUF2255 family protein [Amycolatopsis acidicola]|uniref:DUF2255 family protein n=1 Tax=Amycolatopsis acidicola TaxID=2596893 RepID=A0A5N0VEM3_9PSEU|nr:DUF2255 family protein [Amycolatopsis acidicola]KAA9163281.1 DUF2255 family protein [Amycolatopsis acidicola]
MTKWTAGDLDRFGDAEELEITTPRADGSPRPWVPIWGVRVGDEFYVRSYRGAGGGWYRRASAEGSARIRAAGLELEVTAEQPGGDTRAAVDAAYREKYARYGATFLKPMLAAQAVDATLRLTPR